jgi:hypothetical protein
MVYQMDNEALDRFWAKVNKDTESGCWEWTGALNSMKYGNLTYKQKNYLAHRVSYSLIHGEIPKGLDLDHLCRNTKCINPDHLEAVTHRENLMRGAGVAKTHCPQSHPYDEANTYIDKRGGRQCRACNRERGRARRRAQNE